MSTQENKKQDSLKNISIVLGKVFFILTQSVVEIFYGLKRGIIDLHLPLAWGGVFNSLVLTKLDQKIFSWINISFLYPSNIFSFSIYSFFGTTLGFWIWGLIQAIRKNLMIERLTESFNESGLKSPMGKIPNFIHDKPIDDFVRHLRVTQSFLPKAKFVEAKSHLESALQVFIDEIKENKASGTIDILYSHHEIPKLVELYDLMAQVPNQFVIGQTRAKTIFSSFKETPHLLIGGQTGGGKSTFLRALITTLYCNNKDYDFSLIDMKGGLEFQLFEKRRRIKVISNHIGAKDKFTSLDGILADRFSLLKANNCKDIEEFQNQPEDKLIWPKEQNSESLKKLNRIIVVIDEAAELFLSSTKNKITDTQDLVRKVIRIAAQGRAVGIHLIIATQKPDTNAINSQIKANLTGILSFPMATLGASMSILGNGRAKELPSIPGRGIWKNGLDQFEVQTPFITPELVKIELDKISPRIETEGSNETKE